MWNLHTAWMPIFPVGREEEHGTNSIGYRHESESEVTQSRLTLCDPMDCSLPGSSVHGIFQARVLEWVAVSFSRGSSRPRDRARASRTAGRRFTIWASAAFFDPQRQVSWSHKGFPCSSAAWKPLRLQWLLPLEVEEGRTPPAVGFVLISKPIIWRFCSFICLLSLKTNDLELKCLTIEKRLRK